MRIITQWLPSMWRSYGRAEYSSFRTVDSGNLLTPTSSRTELVIVVEFPGHPLAEIYRDMGYVSRREGILVLASLADEVDDPVLEVGIRESVHGDEVRRGPAHVLKCMEDRLQQLRLALHERHWFVIAGTLAIQAPANPTTSLPRRGQQAKGFRALDPPTSTQARRLKVGDAPYVMGPHVLDTLLVKKELSSARQHPTSRSRPRPF